jgi:hypothetical protein
VDLDSYLTHHTKINLKWIHDPNVRANGIKFLVESIEEKVPDMDLTIIS